MARQESIAALNERQVFRRLLWGYGFLGWGLGTALVVAAALAPVAVSISRPSLLLVPLLLFPLGGLLWACLFWHGYAKFALRNRRNVT